jgi:enterobactin synthetase component D / holo-[acyl-carrier protein] synthase
MPPTLLHGLTPKAVVVEERFEDPPEMGLLAEEAIVVAKAIEKRRREFTAVRVCARAALAALGMPAAPILPRGDAAPRWARRAPDWPPGVVGSMTHCDGYQAAALALRSQTVSIGVDAEPHLPLPAGVASLITVPSERDALATLNSDWPEVAWERLLFSIKESIYKAWFPLTGQWLNFDECTVTLHPEVEWFTARLSPSEPSPTGRRIDHMDGRWRLLSADESQTAAGLIGTAVVIEN